MNSRPTTAKKRGRQPPRQHAQEAANQRETSLVEALRTQAKHRENHVALVLLPDGENESERLTYADLDTRARGFAAFLQSQGLADTGEGPFLRSGDLGVLHKGELYVTGRRKDLSRWCLG